MRRIKILFWTISEIKGSILDFFMCRRISKKHIIVCVEMDEKSKGENFGMKDMDADTG